MGDNEALIRLILEAVGTGDVVAMKDAIDALQSSLDKLQSTQAKAASATSSATAATKAQAAATAAATDDTAAYEAALARMQARSEQEAQDRARDAATVTAAAKRAFDEQEAAAKKAFDAEVAAAHAAADEIADEWGKLQSALKAMDDRSRQSADEKVRDSLTVTKASQRQYDEMIKASNKAMDALSKDAKKTADAQAKEAQRAAKAQEDAILSTMVPLSKVQVSGIKLQDNLAKAAEKAGSGANSAGYRFMQLGQTIDDLQYVPEQGLRPIINNVMQIAPAVGLALIAVEVLRKAFGDDLVEAYKSFTGAGEESIRTLEGFQEKIDKLTAKKHKVQMDYQEVAQTEEKYRELKEAKDAFERGRKSEAEAELEKQSAGVVEKNLGGTVELARKIAAMDRAEGVRRGTPEDEAKLAEFNRVRQALIASVDKEDDRMIPVYEKKIREITATIEDATRTAQQVEAGSIAAGDTGAITRLKQRAGRNPNVFDASEMDAIDSMAATPQDVIRRKRAEEQAKAEDEREKAGVEKAVERAKAKEKLEEEGRKQQRILDGLTEQEAKDKQKAIDDKKKADDKLKNEAHQALERGVRDAKQAGKVETQAEKEARLAQFSVPIRAQFPDLADNQVDHFAKQAQAANQKGLNQETAINQTLRMIYGMMVQNNAMVEAQSGQLGFWTMKFQELQAEQQQVRQQQRQTTRRMQRKLPALGPGRANW